MKLEIISKTKIDINYPEILKLLIQMNREIHFAHSIETMSYISPLHYVKNFGTIHLDVGRGVGKTKFISDNATMDDLVIAHRYTRQIGYDFSRTNMMYPYDNYHKYRAHKPFSKIWIDEPDLLSENMAYDDVVRLLIKNYDQMIILLGT